MKFYTDDETLNGKTIRVGNKPVGVVEDGTLETELFMTEARLAAMEEMGFTLEGDGAELHAQDDDD